VRAGNWKFEKHTRDKSKFHIYVQMQRVVIEWNVLAIMLRVEFVVRNINNNKMIVLLLWKNTENQKREQKEVVFNIDPHENRNSPKRFHRVYMCDETIFIYFGCHIDFKKRSSASSSSLRHHHRNVHVGLTFFLFFIAHINWIKSA
jgi:hypothetical protein